jgi:hypothetical protein
MSAAWAESAAELAGLAAIERRARELADRVRRQAPYGPADLAELARLVDQLGAAETPQT